jgi:hypothetical protein
LVRPDGLFALRAHPFGAALWAFSADAAPMMKVSDHDSSF